MVSIKKKHTGIEKNKFIFSDHQKSEKQKKKKKHAP
tara:strand:- start:122 stop:229 length:108 start_codon:yes stop_codon:yes gene_type:complete